MEKFKNQEFKKVPTKVQIWNFLNRSSKFVTFLKKFQIWNFFINLK